MPSDGSERSAVAILLGAAASVWAAATALFARHPGTARIGLGRAARWYAWITLGTVAFLYPAVRALFKP